MASVSRIEWTGRTWNPVRGCSVISPGCVNCYAMKQAHRFSGEGKAYHGLTKQTKAGPQWTGVVRTVPSDLLKPLAWRKPARIFVNSMSDLFHESVPEQYITDVFGVMALAHWHTFQILTKRPDRMLEYLQCGDHGIIAQYQAIQQGGGVGPRGMFRALDIKRRDGVAWRWPLPNVWLGVSIENEEWLERADVLKDIPAAVHFLSLEPLLADLGALILDGIEWVIVGGESGHRARPLNVAWVRSIVRQCKSANVPVFVKQLGANVHDRNDAEFDGSGSRAWPADIEERDAVEDNPNGFREEWQGADVRVRLRHQKGGNMHEWPADLRVRQYPNEVNK